MPLDKDFTTVFVLQSYRGSLKVNATIIKDASLDLAQASLELVTQQDGVYMFDVKYYVYEMDIGGQPSKCRVTFQKDILLDGTYYCTVAFLNGKTGWSFFLFQLDLA